MSTTRLRCAVYTRESSEEGLEQAFNSLDAQREAGLDYIRSQKHQGWKPIETEYADGVITLTLDILIKKHDNRRVLVSPTGSDLFLTHKARDEPVPQKHLVQAIGRAFALHREHLKAGGSIDELRKQFKIARGRIEYLMQLTQLSPAVVSAVLTGRLAPSVTLRDLHATARHLDWSLQVAELTLETR